MAKSLKKSRSSIKGQLTSLLSYVKGNPVDDDVESFDIRLTRAHQLLNMFSDTEEKLFEVDDEVESEMEEFSEKYFVVVAALNKLKRESSLEQADLNNSLVTMNTYNSNNSSIDVKLPDIHIPKFSGEDITKWQPFYQLFSSAIHNCQKLNGTRKFFYLKSYLVDEASGLVEHLALTEENYIQALKILKERYGRQKNVIYDYIRKFINQPSINLPNAVNVRKLLNTSEQITKGLEALGTAAEHRDHWLIFMLQAKLDDESKTLWAQNSTNTDSPLLQDFYNFLLHRSDCLESIGTTLSSCHPTKSNSKKVPSSSKSFLTSSPENSEKSTLCSLCSNGSHLLYECSELKALPIEKRRDFIKHDRRCFNCLNKNHSVYYCRSRARCTICNRKHHTLVHTVNSENEKESIEKPNHEPSTSEEADIVTSNSSNASSTSFYCKNPTTTTLLPTAIVKIQNKFGRYILGRALLDSCSASSFVTESFAQNLQLVRKNARISVSGLGHTTIGESKGYISMNIMAKDHDIPLRIDALIMQKITSNVPSVAINCSTWNHIKDLNLADDHFNLPGKIDLLLGVDTFFGILKSGVRHGEINQPIARETAFGWIIGGKYNDSQGESISLLSTPTENETSNIDKLLRMFWKVEDVPTCDKLTEVEQRCETIFQKSMKFKNGRIEIDLPFYEGDTSLGESKYLAVNRLRAIERRFAKDPKFQSLYVAFMEEYENLGHMKEIPLEHAQQLCKFFLPHHGVLKESSTTTKLRVVFDGSVKSTNGRSLNDILLVGPTIQSTLFSILVRFRKHKYVFTADAEKMYRQVLVAEKDRPYQCIVWRKNTAEPIKCYQLNTVTYGTSAAPFLATRAIVEVASMNQSLFPDACRAIKNDMYVDDLMSGSNTVEEAVQIKTSIQNILSNAGFEMRKWVSNSDRIVLHSSTKEAQSIEISENDSTNVKVLGLHWNPATDCFSFKVKLDETFVATKRKLLSESSRIFDPLGWLAPTIISIKILFQRLWLLNLEWDDPLPEIETKFWRKLRNELPILQNCSIPRWIYAVTDVPLEIHGFCDASQYAYAAVIYSRVFVDGQYVSKIIASKTKVAPISQLSIPKLELCGAVLLVKLMNSIISSLDRPINSITLWTDSKIVLDWLSGHPRKWTTFIANRTAQILESFSRQYWKHVSSAENPADCASRGLAPVELAEFNLWWNGPVWFNFHESSWKIQQNSFGTCEEVKLTTTLFLSLQNQAVIEGIIAKNSSFFKMTRILALVKRFIHNRVLIYNKSHKIVKHSCSYITRAELNEAELILIKYEQNQYLSEKMLDKDSCIRSLNAFLDEKGILRVGGRLDNSSANYEVKHPIIIHNKSHIASSIIKDYHLRYHHAGFTLLSGLLKQRFWIIRSKVLIRSVLRKCIHCFRQNPKCENQLMGNLPAARVEYQRPFLKVGVDYAGPILAYFKRARGQKPHKTYICLFVCMATKAVHIEIAFDLSTESFLAAFKRFISRRGVCSDIFSDNGTNFVGANNSLKEMFKFLNDNQLIIAHSLLADKITWHFNPPSASHFGGLFETAIKSTKMHLKRTIGEHLLTYEELLTLITEIECTLNSRPICLQSVDTLEPLTPFHFILGQSAVQLPSINLLEEKQSHLSHWQTVERIRQHYWRRWNVEYLTALHQRAKWFDKRSNLRLGDIVIIKDENTPPAVWKMAKVIEIHPGKDHQVRVVSVQTPSGILRRPIHKLCMLPSNS